MKMDMFCKIMNRIRRYADNHGSTFDDVIIRIYLIDGRKMLIGLADYEICDNGFIEACENGSVTHFIPIENIISISF